MESVSSIAGLGIAVIELDAVNATKCPSFTADGESAMKDDERVTTSQNIELVTVLLIVALPSDKRILWNALLWPQIGVEPQSKPTVAAEDRNTLPLGVDEKRVVFSVSAASVEL